MGNLKFVGGSELFKITPKPKLDVETKKRLEDIPATVLMEELRQRLLKYPKGKDAFSKLEGLQLTI